MGESAAMAGPVRVAVTLEQCWHRVPGGTAAATIEQVGALGDRHDVDLVGVSAWHRHPAPVAFRPPIDVRPLLLPRRALYESWQRARWPRVEVATGAVEVIHATAVAVPPRTAPLAVTIHDLAFLADPTHATARGNRFFGRGTDLARAEADLVMCPSKATMRECEAAGFDPAKLRLVPWGTRVRPVGEGEVADVLRRHGITRPYILFTGTIEPRKNLAGLVHAFRRVRRSDVDLVLVGPHGWNEDLAVLLDGLDGRARHLGFVPRTDRDALYAGAAVFCYPSLREGFGLPVLEAMAQGAPVVTSAGTATEEVAGDAAVLVDPRDATALTDSIDRVLDDAALAESLAAKGRARAATFTWEGTAARTAAVYAELAK